MLNYFAPSKIWFQNWEFTAICFLIDECTEKECELPCQATEFLANVQKLQIERSDSMTYIGLTYQTNTVSTNEENLVNDILNLIGTVDRSLALFISCSFYDGCQLAEKRFWKKQK